MQSWVTLFHTAPMPTENLCGEAYLFMDEHQMDLCDLKATAHKQNTG